MTRDEINHCCDLPTPAHSFAVVRLKRRIQDACEGGSTVQNVQEYCNGGYEGPCKCWKWLLLCTVVEPSAFLTLLAPPLAAAVNRYTWMMEGTESIRTLAETLCLPVGVRVLPFGWDFHKSNYGVAPWEPSVGALPGLLLRCDLSPDRNGRGPK